MQNVETCRMEYFQTGFRQSRFVKEEENFLSRIEQDQIKVKDCKSSSSAVVTSFQTFYLHLSLMQFKSNFDD